MEGDVEISDRWAGDIAHGEVGSMTCTQGGPSAMPTDNLFGVERPTLEEGGLQGSQEDDRLQFFGDRRSALHGLQGLDRFIDPIHGLSLPLVPCEFLRIPLPICGFPRPGGLNCGFMEKATAASLRDLSTICNIVVLSRKRDLTEPRFNVGEEAA